MKVIRKCCNVRTVSPAMCCHGGLSWYVSLSLCYQMVRWVWTLCHLPTLWALSHLLPQWNLFLLILYTWVTTLTVYVPLWFGCLTCISNLNFTFAIICGYLHTDCIHLSASLEQILSPLSRWCLNIDSCSVCVHTHTHFTHLHPEPLLIKS